MDLPVAERLAKAFEAKFPGIAVRVERTGAERLFQRIGQEYAEQHLRASTWSTPPTRRTSSSGSATAGLRPTCRRRSRSISRGAIAIPTAPARDNARLCLCSLAYNTNLVKAEEAPKSFADLLDPKWTGKMVKAHPAYSGTIMTATFQIARELGWEYFEKLAKQKVMQVQSATDPPKKLALGERAVMADGNDYLIQLKEQRPAGRDRLSGARARRSSPGRRRCSRRRPTRMPRACSRTGCIRARAAAAGRFRAPVFGARAGQWRSRAARKLAEIKLMQDDPAGVDEKAQAEEIKARYAKIFRV